MWNVVKKKKKNETPVQYGVCYLILWLSQQSLDTTKIAHEMLP